MNNINKIILTLFMVISANYFIEKVWAQMQSTPYENLIRNRYYFKMGLQQVDNICQSFTGSSIRNECNNILSSASFFDADAVFFCEQKFNISSRTVNCFKYIKDKLYVESELKECGNSINDTTIFQCLRKKGRPYVN